MTKCDVLVIGAGPAGCAAAIMAARAGLRVILAEAAAFPRELPGEALHPDVDASLKELGVLDAVANAGFMRYPGWMLVRGRKRQFVPFGEEGSLMFGYQAWRADFDALLLERARKLRVKLMQPARVAGFVLRNGRPVAARIGSGEVAFRYVVDASGGNGVVRRGLGLAVTRVSPKLVARYGYEPGDGAIGAIPEFRVHVGGWTWVARVKADCCQFVRLALEPGTQLDDMAPPFPVGRIRGADVTWRYVAECAGPGYFLAGDAALVLDPSAAGGVARALASGCEVGRLVVKIATGRDHDEAAARYRQWTKARFDGLALQMAFRYGELTRAPRWVKEFLRKHENR